MSKTEHSPTPWAVAAFKKGGQKLVIIADAPGKPYMTVIADCLVEGPNDEANAAFIVKAANLHDELVAALQGIAAIAPATADEATVVPALFAKLNHAMKLARDTVAKAEAS